MPDYQKLYTTMFNAVTDALTELGHFNLGRARDILRSAQQKAEELYVGGDGEAGLQGTEETVEPAEAAEPEKIVEAREAGEAGVKAAGA